MTESAHDYQVLLDLVRQNFASVVWTHKIQEKQADIYAEQYAKLQTVNIIAASVTSCGIISTIFAGDSLQLVLKIITALLSFATLCITAYFKSFDLQTFGKANKEAANQFLIIRNELLQIIGDIHLRDESVEDIEDNFKEIMQRLNNLYLSAPSTTDKAVKRASQALNCKNEYTYSENEIDRFLPVSLRGKIEK
jgi:hypothetical protein